MLRLAQKSFFPGKIRSLLHVDNQLQIPRDDRVSDSYAKETGAELIVHQTAKRLSKEQIPLYSDQKCCGLLKTKRY